MILKRQISVLFFLLLTSLALGNNPCDSLSNRTILFKISHQNSEKISYLFGTHHAFGELFFNSLTNVNQLLTSCNILIKENLNIPGHTAEDIINNRGEITKWNKYLSKKDLSYVKSLFAKSPTNFKKMTPTEMYVFLNRYYKQQICLNKNITDTSLSLDDYIGFKAKQQNLKLIGLETTEEQIELINKDVEGMPRKNHKRRLYNVISKIKSKNTNDCVETEWYKQMEIGYELDKPCRNTLVLTDRNDKWMKTITELLKTNNCFIVVGLSHLMYECGLITQLQELGYEVEPIKVK